MDSTAAEASFSSIGPDTDKQKSGGKNCVCSEKWCQRIFPGACDKSSQGCLFGGHRLSGIPDDVLRKWMSAEQKWLTVEDPDWTAESIDHFVRNNRFNAMRVGRWHFS